MTPSNFARVVNEIKRNSSKRHPHEIENVVLDGVTKAGFTKKTHIFEDKSMYRYLSIDTEEDREKYSKRSLPAKHSSDGNKKNTSHKNGAKQKQKELL